MRQWSWAGECLSLVVMLASSAVSTAASPPPPRYVIRTVEIQLYFISLLTFMVIQDHSSRSLPSFAKAITPKVHCHDNYLQYYVHRE